MAYGLQEKQTLSTPTSQNDQNTLKELVGNLPMNCLSVFDHFVVLAFKGLNTFCVM